MLYPIKKQTEGIYVQFNFQLTPSEPQLEQPAAG
jgi:ribosomal protein S6